MTSIKNNTDYNTSFPDEVVKKEALKQALDIRKFEIELYWKRATYFWSLIAAAFAGYFALSNSKEQLLPLLISCIGLVLSVGWFQVNRGSKYWQSNWERHVDCLEGHCQLNFFRLN
jgi:lipopolysaccharide export LptBFGC system permease protein LptF